MNRCLAMRRALWGWGLLLLAACAPVERAPSPAAPTNGAAACSVASLTNPARLSPGLGGTGSPAVRGPDPGGIGGTGQVATGGGVGGTGSPVQTAEPGSGLGGTGIVGVVTGFASICVNGVEVEYEPATPVQRDGRAEPISELAVGQLVALQAEGEGDRLRARHIAVLDAAVGPLTALEAASGRFAVMGQPSVALERGDLQGLRLGDWVRVSGLRVASGEIRATRVQRAMAGMALATGPYLATGAGEMSVGATPVNLSGLTVPQGLVAGQEIRVRGEWVAGRIRAREIQPQPTRQAVGGSSAVLLQGYVHAVNGREVRLGYDTVMLSDSVRVDGGKLDGLAVNQVVRVHGRLDARQRVTVDRLEFRGEGRRGESVRGLPAVPTQGVTTGPAATSTKTSGDDSSGTKSSGDDSSGAKGSGDDSSGTQSSGDDSKSGSAGSDDSGKGRGRGRGGDSDSSGRDSSGSGSSGGGSSGGGSSGSGSSGSGSSGGGSSGSGSSGSGGGSSGSGSSGSGGGSSGSGSSGSGSGSSGSGSSGSGSGSSGSGSSGSGGDSGGDSGKGRGRGRGRSGKD